jgi:hypothetical protein
MSNKRACIIRNTSERKQKQSVHGIRKTIAAPLYTSTILLLEQRAAGAVPASRRVARSPASFIRLSGQQASRSCHCYDSTANGQCRSAGRSSQPDKDNGGEWTSTSYLAHDEPANTLNRKPAGSFFPPRRRKCAR